MYRPSFHARILHSLPHPPRLPQYKPLDLRALSKANGAHRSTFVILSEAKDPSSIPAACPEPRRDPLPLECGGSPPLLRSLPTTLTNRLSPHEKSRHPERSEGSLFAHSFQP